jgi:hypothetical protein
LEAGKKVFSYIAIRSDEEFREGYRATHPNLKTVLPLKEAGIDKGGVIEILEASGLGLPKYYRWRSRSGCTFCFFQQKIEWVRLKDEHPEAFEEAKKYEKTAIDNGSPFTWAEGESLNELANPERVKQIKQDYEERLVRAKAKRVANPLRSDNEEIDIDELYGKSKVCLACHK